MARPGTIYAWDPEDPDEFDPDQGFDAGALSRFEPRNEREAQRFVDGVRDAGFSASNEPPDTNLAATPDQVAFARAQYEADREAGRLPFDPPTSAAPSARGPSSLVAQYPEDDAPVPAPQPPMQEKRVPWEALQQYRGSGAATKPTPVRGPNKGLLIAGSIFDALLNRGRGIGTLMGIAGQGDNLAAENEDRRMRAEAHDANMMRALAQAEGREVDPFTQWLRSEQLKLRERSTKTGERKEGRLTEETERQHTPGNAAAQAVTASLLKQGVPQDFLDGLSEAQQLRMLGLYGRQVDLENAPARAANAAQQARQVAQATIDTDVEETRRKAEATLPIDIARSEATRSAGVTADQQKADSKLTAEVIQLENLRRKLLQRQEQDGDDTSLPNQGTFIERGAIKARAQVFGGTGMSDVDSSLDTDLTALGLQTYTNRAGNAPNSEREQNVAATMYRGDGTVGGALGRVNQRLAEIEQTRAAEQKRIASSRSPQAPPAPPPPAQTRATQPTAPTPAAFAPAAKPDGDEWEEVQ